MTDLVDCEPEAGAEELGGEDRAEMTDTAVAGEDLVADTTTDEGAADDRDAEDDDDDEDADGEVAGDEVADEGEAPEGSAE